MYCTDKNCDNLCAPCCIIVGLTYHTNVIFDRELNNMEIKQIRMGRKIQTDLAQELCLSLIHI